MGNVGSSAVEILFYSLFCVYVCVLTELLEGSALTSKAVPSSHRGGQSCGADRHTDGSLVQPETGDELSDTMTARHMSIKER